MAHVWVVCYVGDGCGGVISVHRTKTGKNGADQRVKAIKSKTSDEVYAKKMEVEE